MISWGGRRTTVVWTKLSINSCWIVSKSDCVCWLTLSSTYIKELLSHSCCTRENKCAQYWANKIWMWYILSKHPNNKEKWKHVWHDRRDLFWSSKYIPPPVGIQRFFPRKLFRVPRFRQIKAGFICGCTVNLNFTSLIYFIRLYS